MNSVAEKFCNKCQRTLPVENFGLRKGNSGNPYRRSQCKTCILEKNAFYIRQSRTRRGIHMGQPRPKTENKDRSKKEKKPEISEYQAEKLRRYAAIAELAQTKTRNEICDLLAVSECMVKNALRHHGLPAPWVIKKQKKVAKIIEMRVAGKSAGEIIKAVKTSSTLIYKTLRANGLYTGYHYEAPDRSHLQAVPLEKLKKEIIKPGIEAHLAPLLKYRGNQSLGRVHRLWNFLTAMRMVECQSLSEGIHHFFNEEKFSHLCGPIIRPTLVSMESFTSRVIYSPEMKRLNPEIYEYAREMNLRPMRLTPIGYANNPSMGEIAFTAEAAKYKFLVHEAKSPEHELTRLINAVVPTNLPMELRADICQDLAVGILCGDFSKDDLSLPLKEITARVRKMFPDKWGPLSLDAPIAGTDGLTLMDTI